MLDRRARRSSGAIAGWAKATRSLIAHGSPITAGAIASSIHETMLVRVDLAGQELEGPRGGGLRVTGSADRGLAKRK